MGVERDQIVAALNNQAKKSWAKAKRCRSKANRCRPSLDYMEVYEEAVDEERRYSYDAHLLERMAELVRKLKLKGR